MGRVKFLLCAVAVVALATYSPAKAEVVYYASQGSFDAASSGLSTQTFSTVAANLGVGVVSAIGIDNPLQNSTNSGMLSGLSINATTSYGSDIAVLGPGNIGNANYAVFANNQGAGLNFAFSPGVTAASLDVLAAYPGNVNISVYGPSSNLLGTYTVSNAPYSGAGEFFGVTANPGYSIGSITITAPNGLYPYQEPGVDQVQFGSAAAPVPEPVGMIGLVGLGGMGLIGLVWRGRRAAV